MKLLCWWNTLTSLFADKLEHLQTEYTLRLQLNEMYTRHNKLQDEQIALLKEMIELKKKARE
jgi:hypothetical protein